MLNIIVKIILIIILFGVLNAKEIEWQTASRHFGEVVTVKGEIVRGYKTSKVCYLNFHTNYREHLSLVIFARSFSAFPQLPLSFENQIVKATGKITEYKGQLQIILNSPNQIEIIDRHNRQPTEIRTDSSSDSENIVSYINAAKYVGKRKTVTGNVVNTYRTDKAIFLNFDEDYRNHFSAVIFASNFNKFSFKPEVYYKNRFVQVSGMIKEYKGKPEIIVKDPDQIDFMDRETGIEAYCNNLHSNPSKAYNCIQTEYAAIKRFFDKKRLSPTTGLPTR